MHLRTLGDHITQMSLELAPMQRMQIKQRVLEVAEEVTVVSKSDESCAMVSSFTEEVCRSEKGPDGQDGQEAMVPCAIKTKQQAQQCW